MLAWTGPDPVKIDTSLFDSLLVSLISDILMFHPAMGYVDFPRPSRFKYDYEKLLSEVAFENHIEDRWVLSNFIIEEGEPVRQALVDLIQLIDNELNP